MKPKHDEPVTGLEDFDPGADRLDDTLNTLLEVMAAQTELYRSNLRDQQKIAEVLLEALDQRGSRFCEGCTAARQTADALRDTAIQQLEGGKQESEDDE